VTRRTRSQAQQPRTIAVTYRGSSRFSRVRLRHPGERRGLMALLIRRSSVGDIPPPAQPYDAELVMELLDNTGELPGSKRGLYIVLTHYRYALRQLATEDMARRTKPAAGPAGR
jgi:hypothetical protein